MNGWVIGGAAGAGLAVVIGAIHVIKTYDFIGNDSKEEEPTRRVRTEKVEEAKEPEKKPKLSDALIAHLNENYVPEDDEDFEDEEE